MRYAKRDECSSISPATASSLPMTALQVSERSVLRFLPASACRVPRLSLFFARSPARTCVQYSVVATQMLVFPAWNVRAAGDELAASAAVRRRLLAQRLRRSRRWASVAAPASPRSAPLADPNRHRQQRRATHEEHQDG